MDYSSNEAAAALGVTRNTIHNWINDGKLHAKYVGLRRIVKIEETELRRFAREHRVTLNIKQ